MHTTVVAREVPDLSRGGAFQTSLTTRHSLNVTGQQCFLKTETIRFNEEAGGVLVLAFGMNVQRIRPGKRGCRVTDVPIGRMAAAG